MAESQPYISNHTLANPVEFKHFSGDHACLEQPYEASYQAYPRKNFRKYNTNLFFESDMDKRPALGLFFTKEDNSNLLNTDAITDDKFVTIETPNFVANGDASAVKENFGNSTFWPQEMSYKKWRFMLASSDWSRGHEERYRRFIEYSGYNPEHPWIQPTASDLAPVSPQRRWYAYAGWYDFATPSDILINKYLACTIRPTTSPRKRKLCVYNGEQDAMDWHPADGADGYKCTPIRKNTGMAFHPDFAAEAMRFNIYSADDMTGYGCVGASAGDICGVDPDDETNYAYCDVFKSEGTTETLTQEQKDEYGTTVGGFAYAGIYGSNNSDIPEDDDVDTGHRYTTCNCIGTVAEWKRYGYTLSAKYRSSVMNFRESPAEYSGTAYDNYRKLSNTTLNVPPCDIVGHPTEGWSHYLSGYYVNGAPVASNEARSESIVIKMVFIELLSTMM